MQVLERVLMPIYGYSEIQDDKTLKPFSRESIFRQFILNVIGALLREDTYGVTSFVRSLHLPGSCYQNILHMFHSSGINIQVLRHAWIHSVRKAAPLFYSASELKKKPEDQSITLVIDHKKNSKEARHMPLVHKMFQESDTQSKAQYIFGHCWGAVGILIGKNNRLACLPLIADLEEGLDGLAQWKEASVRNESMIIRLYRNAIECAGKLEHNCRFLADRAFLNKDGLKMIDDYNNTSKYALHILTKCKNGVTGYTEPEKPIHPKKGRPRKKGKTVKLNDLFKTKNESFTTEEMTIYGEKKSVRYYCIDLLWGQGYYKKLRFVLSVMDTSTRSILVTDDLTLTAKEIIEGYCLRYRVETMFRTMSQNGTFNYRFWTKSMDKLNRFMKSDDPDPLSKIRSPFRRRKILECIQAIEMYVLVCSIATGINQIISVTVDIDSNLLRWQRTPAKKRPSEENVAKYIQDLFFDCFRAGVIDGDYRIMQIIRDAQSHESRASA